MRTVLISMITLIFVLSCSQVYAQENTKTDKKLELKFVDTDLEVFIGYIAKETGKRILYDPSIRGKKVFLESPIPVHPKDLFKLFCSVIEYQGYILETVGEGGSEVIKVKRSIQGPWTQTPVIMSREELEKIQNEDLFITMIVSLKFISAREVQTTLRALRIVNPQGGNLAGIEDSNTILITDFAPNVKRIYDVIQLMDKEIVRGGFTATPVLKPLPLNLEETDQLILCLSAYGNTRITVTRKEDELTIAMIDSTKNEPPVEVKKSKESQENTINKGQKVHKIDLSPYIQHSGSGTFIINVESGDDTGFVGAEIGAFVIQYAKETKCVGVYDLNRRIKPGSCLSIQFQVEKIKKFNVENGKK